MDPWIWIALAAFGVVLGAGFVYIVMNSRMEVLLSEQRAELAAARASLETERGALELQMKNAEKAVRAKAMEEFLSDIRIEERHYTREHKMLFLSRKSLVRQERIFFRNIPLSNWIEHEMPIEEGADVDKLASTMAVFTNALLPEPPEPANSFGTLNTAIKLLRAVH